MSAPPRLLPLRVLLLAGLCSVALQPAAARRPPPAQYVPTATPVTQGGTAASTIAAIVNGDVISKADVDARRRLFAMSTGLPMTPEVLNHLNGQVLRALIDEKLRLQEIERRKITVGDSEIAAAITDIETRNRMKQGDLLGRLTTNGIPERTLIDELRVQIGWTRVLREALGERARITRADIDSQQAITKTEAGQPEYDIAEIFIPVDNPSHATEAQAFANTVITQLHAGAPFAVVAAQFSQAQTALQGGDVGWRQSSDLEPAVAGVVTQMPIGAISNPIEVPGGYMIVSLHAKRTVGSDLQTVLDMRQVFMPFTTPLNPQAPTEQQKATLLKARQISATVHTCADIEAANQSIGAPRPANPGDVMLANVNPPQFQTLLATIPLNKASSPLVSTDGIVVLAVCGRSQRNVASETEDEIATRLVNERAELISRQLERDLQRRGVIDTRSGA